MVFTGHAAVPLVTAIATVTDTIIYATTGYGYVSPPPSDVSLLKFAKEMSFGTGTRAWFITTISNTVTIVIVYMGKGHFQASI